MNLKKAFKYELNSLGWIGFFVFLAIIIVRCKIQH